MRIHFCIYVCMCTRILVAQQLLSATKIPNIADIGIKCVNFIDFTNRLNDVRVQWIREFMREQPTLLVKRLCLSWVPIR